MLLSPFCSRPLDVLSMIVDLIHQQAQRHMVTKIFLALLYSRAGNGKGRSIV